MSLDPPPQILPHQPATGFSYPPLPPYPIRLINVSLAQLANKSLRHWDAIFWSVGLAKFWGLLMDLDFVRSRWDLTKPKSINNGPKTLKLQRLQGLRADFDPHIHVYTSDSQTSGTRLPAVKSCTGGHWVIRLHISALTIVMATSGTQLPAVKSCTGGPWVIRLHISTLTIVTTLLTKY